MLIAKKFKSVGINKQKKQLIKDVAIKIRTKKNELSNEMFFNYRKDIFFSRSTFYHKNMISHDFIKSTQYMRDISYGCTFFQEAQKEVYANYLAQTAKLKCCFHSTSNLHKVVKYLVFHYNPNNPQKFFDKLTSYISSVSNKKSVSDDEINKMKFFQLVLDYINKYSKRPSNELMKTVEYIQNLMILRIHKCKYESLNFSSYNMLSNRRLMIEHAINLSKKSKVNGIINFNLQKVEKLIQIPCQISKSYHEDLASYNYGYNKRNQSYIYYNFIFCDDGEIAIHLLKDDPNYGKNNVAVTTLEEDVIGVDVNTKNNLFALSDGSFISYDKKLIKKARRYNKYIAKIQHNKEINKNSKAYGKKVLKRINKMNRLSLGHEQRKAQQLIYEAKKRNKKHIVMEDLNIQGCKTKAKHESGNNYNDVAKILHINDYKNEVKRQANKNDLMMSEVNAAFTSQTCSECGHISKSNRPNQETFSCTHCGFTLNADTNAAINIKNRIVLDGLRNALEKYDFDNKMYVGLSYKRKSIYQQTYKKIYG